MASFTFSHETLNVTKSVDTMIKSVGKDNIVLESHPDKTIPIDAAQIKQLKLQVGDKVKLDPVVNNYTLTVEPAPVAKAAKAPRAGKVGSSPRLGEKLSNTLM